MATETQETIVDIIAEMRQGMNPNGTVECQYLESDICMLADRLEAAHKRESGDCAKLREALKNASKELIDATEDENFGEDVMYLVECMRTVSQKCRAALTATEKEGGAK